MNTDLKNLAEQLGIEEYPEILEAVFESTQNEPPLSCVTDVLTQLHEEYDLFGKYYDFLLQGAEEIKKSRALLAWLSLGVRYCKDVSDTDAARFPLPPSDQSLARDAFPAILIAMEFPETVKRYRARGFDDVQIKRNLSNLERALYVHEITQGRTALSAGLYCWLTHYTKALIFDEMGFNFQVWKWRDEAILLKHRKTGEYAFLMLKGNFTAHGTVAGMRGREDEPTLFEATLEETEDAFIGYRAKGQQVSPSSFVR